MIRVDAPTSCPRCQGSGWVCETHRTQPISHRLQDGSECGGAGFPCEESGCPFRTHPTGADAARKQRWRKPGGHVEGKIGVGSTIAWIIALTLIAAMFRMGITKNRICCDPSSLIMSILAKDKSQ